MSLPKPPPRGSRFQPGYSADLHWELYKRTGKFFHLMGAYVSYMETSKEIPESLLLAIHQHFRKALDADDAKIAREALAVDAETHWQERKRTQRAIRLQLLRELGEANGKGPGHSDTRRTAAKMLRGNSGSIKTEHYQDQRSEEPLSEIPMNETIIQWATVTLDVPFRKRVKDPP